MNEYEGETLNWKMNKTDLTVYDKVKEINALHIRMHKVPSPEISSLQNTLRTEFKYYGAGVISDKIGINTFGSLAKDGMFERINKRYIDRANGQIFKYYQPSEIEILDSTILENMLNFFMFPNGQYCSQWLTKIRNYFFHTQLPVNRDEFIELATKKANDYRLSRGMPKDYNASYKLTRNFVKSDIDSLLIDKATAIKNYQMLYEELKLKLVG
jgi:hypothetical protein